ncbi:MAG: SDR family oxidoreductase [Candidatus Micrarchaeota archaeon]|nr:SDR family oxidoreductase [Candidatus Micrarchaeota archaeon]
MENLNIDFERLFSIKGQVAVVTGASGRLGRIHADLLASEGANLALCARNLGPLKELAAQLRHKYKIKVYEASVDITKEKQVETFFKNVHAHFGRIDILINNAGLSGSTMIKPGKKFKALNISQSLWNRIIKANIYSAFIVSKTAIRYMAKHKHGKIINVSSVYGIFIDEVDALPLAAYDTSKGALLTLTRELAIEFAPKGISVNAVAPSYIYTGKSIEKNKILKHWEALTPMKRLGTPQDLRGPILFLSCPASDFITGEVFSVDGGWAAKGKP